MSALFADYDPTPAARHPAFAGRVRQATPADADAIARISVARNGAQTDDVIERIRGELVPEWNGARGAVFVAEESARVIAFARLRQTDAFDDVEEDLRPPAGWYLLGVIVEPEHRRRGIAHALTRARVDWLSPRAGECFYFVRDSNRPSIDLHAPFGFEEHTRNFRYPRTGLEAGAGILYRLPLGGASD